MGNKKLVTKKKFNKALEGSQGNVILLAQRMGVTRGAVYDFMRKNPEFKLKVEQERDELVTLAENQLHIGLLKGDASLIRFALRTKGRHKGWGEKQEIEHQIKPVQINFNVNMDKFNPNKMINVTNKQIESKK